MLFSSMIFLWVFLPVTLVISRLTGKKYANIALLAASLVFYAWGEPVYVFLMIFSIALNWICGLLMIKNNGKYKKPILICGVSLNLLLLAYFKYYNFIVSAISSVFSGINIPLAQIALPIGISFFTFQALSYIIDVYREKTLPEKNLIDLALYISFFPQLIAGPIVKFNEINLQIKNRELSAEKTAEGIRRFIYGLGKKVLIANILAECVDTVYALDTVDITGVTAWAAALMYAMQIYYDFSGYSDVAIGLGKMFGFDIAENFNYPYISTSVREFWTRWHISLSSWFKEYLYIPLGGNRKGKARTLINLLTVFLFTGLWHGANYNFILWGLWHGFFSILERVGLEKPLKKIKPLGWLYTMFVVGFGWVIFRIEDLNKAFDVIKIMCSPLSHRISSVFNEQILDKKVIFVAVIAVLFCGILQTFAAKLCPKFISKVKGSVGEAFLCAILLLMCIMSLAANSYNPFIYFRF